MPNRSRSARRTRFAVGALALLGSVVALGGDASSGRADRGPQAEDAVQLGVRPFYLVAGMDRGALKDKLEGCRGGPFHPTNFSLGHRGAPLQFPEHTRESYEAAARQGAGIVECDVTFTADGELVCRHSECDLELTTNIVNTPLNASCSVPWTGPGTTPKCCTSDLTLAQFKTLKGKMDSSVPSATTAEGFLGGTPGWRTDLYTGRGTLMTLKESIALNESLGADHAPELKTGDAARIKKVFGGQAAYAQKLIDTLLQAHVDPRRVWLQSFELDDVLYWLEHAPEFGRQAVYLVDADESAPQTPTLTTTDLADLKKKGVRILAPPIPALLAVQDGKLVPSQYALDIKRAGLDIITWTLERSDLRHGASKAGFYFAFDPNDEVIKKDSDLYLALDILAQRVGIIGVFSEWPATVTYYANCMGLN